MTKGENLKKKIMISQCKCSLPEILSNSILANQKHSLTFKCNVNKNYYNDMYNCF